MDFSLPSSWEHSCGTQLEKRGSILGFSKHLFGTYLSFRGFGFFFKSENREGSLLGLWAKVKCVNTGPSHDFR